MNEHIEKQEMMITTDVDRNACAKFVGDLMQIQIPEHIKKRPELVKLLAIQANMEAYAANSMYTAIQGALTLLGALDFTDIYTNTGEISIAKVSAYLQTQQQVMNLSQQFAAHIRQLPQNLQNAIDLVQNNHFNAIEIDASTGEQKSEGNGLVTTRKSLAELLHSFKEEQPKIINA